MKYAFITFRSVTYAQRGEQLLAKAGIRCSLQRTPKWMESQGCGYSLRIREPEAEAAAALLRHNQVQLRRVYAQRGDGKLEELLL